jgi:hypothetical protein
VNYTNFDIYIETLNFLIAGRRQNLCWIMSHCSIDRQDAWRDVQFDKIKKEIDLYAAELAMALNERGGMND